METGILRQHVGYVLDRLDLTIRNRHAGANLPGGLG